MVDFSSFRLAETNGLIDFLGIISLFLGFFCLVGYFMFGFAKEQRMQKKNN